MPITILDYVRSRVGEKRAYSTGDFCSNGVGMLGGCEICHAQIACYNAYPSKVRSLALCRLRRNTLAHSLTGSYWETDESIAAMFTTEAMEDSLYTVGTMAILIEEIVTARTTKEETSE